ncbi:MAG: host-nuclease inhibitor Gam family protein [Armatimonadetes bacterium]|nr:host-nuclease inhibitor Gam family protein [Armatimonadota bacterium]
MNTTTPDTDDFFTPEAPGTGGTETAEQFTIQTREHAEWYLRKLANLDREEASIRAQAEAMLTRVRSDRESLMGRYASQFESFTRGELEKQKGSRRSVLYFNGTAQFTSVAPRLIVESELDAITTARAVKPETVTEETITKLDKKTFLAYAATHFEETGELIPGVTRTEPGERFYIKIPKAKGGTTDPDE